MTTLSLQPVRRNTPVCTGYEDLESVVAYEREMRVHRAHTEPFHIELPATAAETWVVRGERGSSWLVDLVDSTREHDACTCPDFLTNELGTCKHLQAVYRAVSAKGRAARLYGLLGATVARATITVDACGPVRLQALGRFTDAQLARLGPGRGLAQARRARAARLRDRRAGHRQGDRVLRVGRDARAGGGAIARDGCRIRDAHRQRRDRTPSRAAASLPRRR